MVGPPPKAASGPVRGLGGPPTAIAHGGALAQADDRDGPARACDVALERLAAGDSPLDAAVAAVVSLEDDGRFNAGRGASPRIDGRTTEMDAACMDAHGRYGGVTGVSVRNPILVARRVLDTPHVALGGEGAMAFARNARLAQPHVPSDAAWARAASVRRLLGTDAAATETEWTPGALRAAWNYEAPFPELECDTVGVVVSDGRTHAVAASTGGLSISLHGRLSDVAMVGGGIFAGPAGCVAVTGHGEYLAQHLVSHHVYRALARGESCQDALAEALSGAHPDAAVGMIALGPGGPATSTNRDMPWAMRTA